MAAVPVIAAREFLEWYGTSLPAFEEAAIQLKEYLQRVLAVESVPLHVVSARAKSPESVRAKLLRKHYANPRTRLTDRIGARVIVYHSAAVDQVADLLRRAVAVRKRDSTDKRRALGLREFGYRSYHLVGSLPPKISARPELRALRGKVFEIQIRSLLDHVWAEIEHNVVYKSGADFPLLLKRRFAAIAAVLELLEHEFQQLQDEALQLVEVALGQLSVRIDEKLALDVPRLLALLELRFLKGLSFRGAQATGQAFPPGIAYRFQLALSMAGISRVRALDRILASPKLRTLRDRYATLEGIAAEEVSHLATLALIVGNRAYRILDVYFPEFAADFPLHSALGKGD